MVGIDSEEQVVPSSSYQEGNQSILEGSSSSDVLNTSIFVEQRLENVGSIPHGKNIPLAVLNKENLSSKTCDDILSIYIFPKKPNCTRKYIGYVGAIVGGIASIDYYFLGMDFGKTITANSKSDILKAIFEHGFGIASYFTNASINILVNQEIGESIADVNCAYNRYLSYRCNFVYKIPKTLMIIHSAFSSLAIMSLLMESIGSWSIGVKILIGIPSFISNAAVFYYTDLEFSSEIYSIYKQYYADSHTQVRIKKLLKDRLKNIRVHLIKIDNNEWLINSQSQEQILSYIKSIPFVTNPRKNKKIGTLLNLFGLMIGIGTAIIFLNVGSDAVKKPCEEMGCSAENQQVFELIFAISTFSSGLAFSITQTSEGLVYLYNRLNNNFSEYQLGTIPLSRKSLIGIIFLSTLSSIPDIYLGIKYFSENTISFLGILIILASGLGSIFVNGKWLTELVEKIYNRTPNYKHIAEYIFHNRCRNAIPNDDIVDQQQIYDKEAVIGAIYSLENQVIKLSSSHIKHLLLSTYGPSKIKSFEGDISDELIPQKNSCNKVLTWCWPNKKNTYSRISPEIEDELLLEEDISSLSI